MRSLLPKVARGRSMELVCFGCSLETRLGGSFDTFNINPLHLLQTTTTTPHSTAPHHIEPNAHPQPLPYTGARAHSRAPPHARSVEAPLRAVPKRNPRWHQASPIPKHHALTPSSASPSACTSTLRRLGTAFNCLATHPPPLRCPPKSTPNLTPRLRRRRTGARKGPAQD